MKTSAAALLSLATMAMAAYDAKLDARHDVNTAATQKDELPPMAVGDDEDCDEDDDKKVPVPVLAVHAPAKAVSSSTAPSSTAPVQYTTSTIYGTKISTIVACPDEVTNCPAKSTILKQVMVAVTTTVCPVDQANPTPHPALGIPAAKVPSPASESLLTASAPVPAPAKSQPAWASTSQPASAPTMSQPTSVPKPPVIKAGPDVQNIDPFYGAGSAPNPPVRAAGQAVYPVNPTGVHPHSMPAATAPTTVIGSVARPNATAPVVATVTAGAAQMRVGGAFAVAALAVAFI